MNIPAKIKPFFYKKKIKTGDNIIIQGKIICCSCSDFYVLYYGNEKKYLVVRNYMQMITD